MFLSSSFLASGGYSSSSGVEISCVRPRASDGRPRTLEKVSLPAPSQLTEEQVAGFGPATKTK